MSGAPSLRTTPAETEFRARLGAGSIHFMGIGGAGMCALAEAMARSGARVTGCDAAPGPAVAPLERLGVPIVRGHDPNHVEGVTLIVVSSAIPMNHPELAAAREKGIPVMKRAEALGRWVDAGAVVAVSGTHGKTTTSAMITAILSAAGLEPTGFVGGWVPAWNGHLLPGRDDLFVVEADEYDRSFLHLHPSVAVVTNLEADHLDVYGDLDGVRAGFSAFLQGVREGGAVLACADDPGASSLLAGITVGGRSFGFSPGSQVRGMGLEASPTGQSFRIREDGSDRGTIHLRVPGLHNAQNALGAAAAARALGVDWKVIRSALGAFRGVERRFQLLGEVAGVTVVDDYAHHPTELDAALSAARQVYPDARLVVAFQPHLYTRTRDFAAGFARSLTDADVVWITEIYPAREPEIPGVDGAFVVRQIEAAAAVRSEHSVREIHLHPDLDTLPEALVGSLEPGDLLLTLGAGTIERVGPEVVLQLQARNRSSGTTGELPDA